jgi:hypothetical protein
MNRAIATRTRVEGHDAVALENDRLRAVVLPGLGGRVWTLEDRARSRQWIWHRDGVPLVACAVGAVYDDVWAGGWEELFPNDAPGAFEGRTLADHGEWWTLAWQAETTLDDDGVCVRLRSRTRTVNAACEKEFRLPHDSAELRVSYRIRSLEPAPFHFLFKQHLPIQLTPACRLVLPGGTVRAVDSSFGTILPAAGPLPWPADGPRGDLQCIPPPSSAAREFVYVSDLPEPWCGADDHETGASLRMHFDAAMPYVWLFLSYGGWRDVYTAVLEPCTNMPKELAEAVRLGQSALLGPGDTFATAVTVRLSSLPPEHA